ncbi:MAG: FtsX-like permease family protein, partial [Rhizobacter sp.]|nr:FtsX-like permease family protein [Rhizobacter sp.]
MATATASLTPSAWQLGRRQLARDFRAGELRLLAVAVMLAVAALTAVGFFADRINAGLARDARQLLGGDAIVASDQPPPADFVAKARALGLLTATAANFPSMGRAPDTQGGATRLVSVKAVSDAYPLRGKLRVRGAAGQGEVEIAAGPAPGTVWVDAAVLDSLALRIGDSLLLGDARLKIARVIVIEPDRGTGFASLAPRVMLNEADLPSTGLVQPASRISYRLALAAPAGRDAAVGQFVAWAENEIRAKNLRGLRIESLATGRPEMRQTLDRAEKFLNLVALLAALLAAVAVGIASRDFADRHLDDCAMLRVLGLPQRTIALQYVVEFALVGVVASVGGLAIGFAVHHVFVWLLAGLVDAVLPPAGAWPALFGIGVGFTLLFGFGVPPVLQLARVPPVRVIRRDIGALKPSSLAVLVAGALGFAALLLAVSSDIKLGLIAVGGFAGAVLVFALLSWLALAALRSAVPEARAPRWLILATRQLAARPAFAVLQVSTLAVGLLALVLLALLRTDLVASWRQATPKDAPNRFVINIQPPQADAFQDRIRLFGVTRYDWFPMIRGRLVAIDGKPIGPDDFADPRARRLVDREFNLSHSASLPAHNQVTVGHWRNDEPGGLSVEEGLAETLGLRLGQTLRFDLGGTTAEGRITSLRKVDWSSMR